METFSLKLSFEHDEQTINFSFSDKIKQLSALISELKDLSQEEVATIYYKDDYLDQEKTLNDYSIPNNSQLTIKIKLHKFRGFFAPNLAVKEGEYIKGKLLLYDPQKKHQAVIRGLNFEFKCDSCNLIVCIQIGIGLFDIGRIVGSQKCSKCNKEMTADQLHNFVFSEKCHWKYEFQASNSTRNQIGEGQNDKNEEYITFDKNILIKYNYLVIYCSRTKDNYQFKK